MIYAAYDRQTGERLWYDTTEAGVHNALKDCYKRDEYIIKEYDSFAEMAGLPVLTDAERQALFDEL